jgi:alanine dehydrogenase
MAMGMEANVTILDTSIRRLRELKLLFTNKINVVFSTRAAIAQHVASADLVIGAVLLPGAEAPKLIDRATLQKMHKGAVVVDVSIDQGGCFETSRPTTHEHPVYVVDDVLHYCVTNMPGAVPRTSTFALNNATLPFILKLANMGYKGALLDDPHLLNGLNVYCGKLTNEPVAMALRSKINFEYLPAKEALEKLK